MPVLTVEKPLRDKLGDDGSDALVRLLNQSREEQKADIIELVEEKFERRLSEEISALETRLTEKIADVKTELTEKIAGLKTELTEKMAANKTEIIKWMFIFWVGQLAVILGILFAFFKK